jgi:hypothetical protein
MKYTFEMVSNEMMYVPGSVKIYIQIKTIAFKYIYYLLNVDVINSDHMTSNYIITSEKWNGKAIEGSCHVIMCDTIPEFAWKDWGKERYISVRITSVPTDIRTRYSHSRSQKPYAWANLLVSFLIYTGYLALLGQWNQGGYDGLGM